MAIDDRARGTARELLAFLDEAPTPWHAVAALRRRLEAAGFRRMDEGGAWELAPGDAGWVERGGSSLVAFVAGGRTPWESGFRVAGAHTDSPGLRVKARGEHEKGGMLRLGVEVYGGPILATWADRDLGLAGRVALKGDGPLDVEERLVDFDRPLLRLPTAAIHLDREVNTRGLLLQKQEELPLVLAASAGDLPERGRLAALLSERLGTDPARILGFELCARDTQPAAFFGPEEEYVASGRIDNLAMCHAQVAGLLEARAAGPLGATAVAAFFDNEEVGSQSARGADGSLLPDVLERVALALGAARADWLRACSRSFLVSADMAHAVHPNHLGLYDPQHHVQLNGGPVVKQNASLRYASDSGSSARFARLCESVGAPCQTYVHRTDLPCGSTIGPMTSARLGIEAVDVGNPMWSMHSVRESAGAADPRWMTDVLAAFWRS